MSYRNQKILLAASEIAFEKGELTKWQFLKIIEDIEHDILVMDKRLLSEDVNKILLEYANL